MRYDNRKTQNTTEYTRRYIIHVPVLLDTMLLYVCLYSVILRREDVKIQNPTEYTRIYRTYRFCKI